MRQRVKIIEVSGERFIIEQSPDDPRQLNVTWLTGPHPGYGFSTSVIGWSGSCETAALEEIDASTGLESSIRSFLSQINPMTGYID
jgi:hypothetical protein